MDSFRRAPTVFFDSGGGESFGRRAMNFTGLAADKIVFLVDEYFCRERELSRFGISPDWRVIPVISSSEPTVEAIDSIRKSLFEDSSEETCAIVGIGGGVTLDTAKAVAVLADKAGSAEDYQGWDLIDSPGIMSIGIPSIFGTGAEATRTAVLTAPKSGLKLGVNSDHTLFDAVLIDPQLAATAPSERIFFTAMDAFMHSFEILAGRMREPLADAYASEGLGRIEKAFKHSDMERTLDDIALASWFGGFALNYGMVGLVHPLSAGLSSVYGVPHVYANCFVMTGLKSFYPDQYELFEELQERAGVKVTPSFRGELTDESLELVVDSALMHEKPLKNALGEEWNQFINREFLREFFKELWDRARI